MSVKSRKRESLSVKWYYSQNGKSILNQAGSGQRATPHSTKGKDNGLDTAMLAWNVRDWEYGG